MKPERSNPRKSRGANHRWRRIAWGVSLAAHLALLIGLGIWCVRRAGDSTDEGRLAASRADGADATRRPAPSAPEPSPEVGSEQVSATLKRTTEKVQELSQDEQLDQLATKAAELEDLASEKSVDELTEKFHEWMNTQPRASEPAADPVAGPFDHATAQIHEVRRTANADGNFHYVGVLVDAAGRTMEVEMSPEEGQTAYRTLQTIKGFPLAEKVYRQIAMPLLDRALAGREDRGAPDDRPAATVDRVENREPSSNKSDENSNERAGGTESAEAAAAAPDAAGPS